MSSILNVLGKTDGWQKHLTIDPATFGNAPKPHGPSAKAKDEPDAGWRDELDLLERRGVGSLPSLEQAEKDAKDLEDQIARHARDLSNQAKKSRQLASSEAFSLSAQDRSALLRQADKLDGQANDFKAGTRVKVAQAKALVDKCREFGPLKPRLIELRERKATLDALMSDPSGAAAAAQAK
jgi:hypothetical protein